MKELKIKVGGLWICITALVVAIMLCGTIIFASTEYSQTQKEIAEMQTKANKEAANATSEGLSDIGRGICQTSNRQMVFCN